MATQQHVALQTARNLTRSHQFRRLFLEVCQILPERSVLSRLSPIAVLEGKTRIYDHAVTLQIGLDRFFPNSLPLIYLVPEDALGFLPHIVNGGYICYAQREGLILNRYFPECIVEETLLRVIQTLEDGVQGKNAADFVDELENYWTRAANAIRIFAAVSPGASVRKIVVAESGSQDHGKYLFVADSEQVIQAYLNDSKLKPHTIRNALFVPLREEAHLVPPAHNTFWTIEQTREYVWSNLTEKNRSLLRKFTKKRKSEEVIIFGIPRSSEGVVLVGVRFSGVFQAHPLSEDGNARSITPLVLDRHDMAYLLPRAGAHTHLHDKRVAIIGCGSVGGFIALELARAGVLNLTLIDNDKIAVENVFRHTLGMHAIGESKVQALKREIESKLPYARISVIPERIEIALENHTFDPGHFDLVVVALGDPTLCMLLNEVVHEKENTPPIVFSWLEPYGIGGHALVAHNGSGSGCYECLFTSPGESESELLYNRAAFAASGQFFAKDVSGCGSSFTPYGSVHAVRTALLAVELIVDVLTNAETGNALVSWRGNSAEFSAAGYTLSDRYALNEDQLKEQRYQFFCSRCLICKRDKE